MKTSLTSLRLILLLLGFAVFAAACLPFVGDGNGDDATPTPDKIPTVIPIERPTQAASTPPVPTIVPLSTQGPQPTSPAPSCTPRNDWPVYTVEAGDTLYSIADRSDTTVDTLQAANCLADPNTIGVGQSLRVPKQPEPREPAATPEPAATQQPFFQGTPTAGTPAATGGVEFTFAIQQLDGQFTATENPPGSRRYQARSSDGAVSLGISATNATSITVVVVGSGKVLGVKQAVSGSTTAGGNFSFNYIDRQDGTKSLIFQVIALRSDSTNVTSEPVIISWP